MSDFDFSMYDPQDTSSPSIKPSHSKVSSKKEEVFDFDQYDPQPEEEKSFLQNLGDYGKTALKGTAEGLSRLGGLMAPLQANPKIEEGKLNLGKTQQQQQEQQTQNLDELLPTDEGYGQAGLRRGLRELPTAMSLPGATMGTSGRAIGAGYLGEGAKELGLPEWAQTAAELTAYVGPDITKKLLETGKNKELMEFAKKMGMSDEQITPLLQSEFKQKWLAKLSPKGSRAGKALSETHQGLQNAYSSLQKSPAAGQVLNPEAQTKLMTSFSELLKDMPSVVRDTIKNDFKDLVSGPITGESLINFYRDINANLGSQTKQLSLLKEPIKRAMSSISPELGKDFEMVNQLYSKYYPIAKRLKPNLTSQLVSAGEQMAVLGAVVYGNVPVLAGLVAEKGIRKLAQEALLNPHMQQLGKKMVIAMNQNKFGMAKKVMDQYLEEVEKSTPVSEDMRMKATEELLDFFNHQK